MSNPVFGIDLGTTYSAIAYINDYGRPEVIRNSEGAETTPSVVFFESESNYVVGKEAKNGALVYRDQTVSLIKRQMGTATKLEFFGQPFFPETVSALILKDLVAGARDITGIDTNDVVITVPAYFGLAEKEATRQAGEIAGLNVVGIITEPVAAALSAGLRHEESKSLLVYDLGGGTFDCTIMRVSPEGVEVLVTDGNRLLGGADWDSVLFDVVAEKFKVQAGLDEDPVDDEDFAQRLITEVEACKMTLSRKEKASIKCSFGSAIEMVEVTRAEFEAATRHLVDQTLEIVARAMEAAQEKSPGLGYDEVLLVGGSARMPMIEASLRERFGWSLTKTEFDLAVAKGAAIYGQGAADWVDSIPARGSATSPEAAVAQDDAQGRPLMIGGRKMTIANVLSRSIGVQFVRDGANGQVEEYIGFLAHAQDSLPLDIRETPVTYSDDTTELMIRIFEQSGEKESDVVADNREITPDSGATFTGLPRLPKGSPVEVNLAIDAEGLATLSAVEPRSGQQLTVTATLSVMQKEQLEAATKIVAGMQRAE
ncbi:MULTISPECIES: Hsp70 family protein [unclassified Modestobacter]|uniref:Hsp70 family protein n=1 Tax=unclassified Modestobacter TaxID=2643866 RepID=UPI0022AAED62|nr:MULTISPECIES: Hsp70 family protein [unclassified Modestobacter]MCZ2826073.1 Hsp70 family protein [Modestobacter sp. VKM Ac-2981]MCZ2852862.1 Hsp70 family protein [Modestobacter sp. VKM Ac-2982]